MIIKSMSIFLLVLLAALPMPSADRAPKVLNGIDVLREQNFAPLAGKRIGLITNHTGISLDGTSTIELFFKSEACKLVALFSPEHGIAGILDENVTSSVDESTGVPIYSLYGETKRPTPGMLQGIDVLVFDIQDIGARFYTYVTTMAYCMEEAAKANIQFFVLDRPNPLGGTRVEGPMLDPDKSSFIGYMPLPVRHGMTVGELARYFNAEKGIGVQLRVIEMQGWLRSYYFWDTGQLWINPSPNMRTMLAAILYPGVCLLERTNVSVGRGTDRPFEIIGAPWIEPRRFADSLREAQIPGVQIVPLFFTPKSSVHQGARCGGINLLLDDLKQINSVFLGLTLVSVLSELYPDDFQMDNVMDFLGNAEAMKRLKAGQSPAEIISENNLDFRKFLSKRRASLIYDITPR
jgi:uncharacterized protein YbbC (DUF1343 family)